ncbi:MAG: hypothetical protein EHM39_08055, partial [Chloroflexi bacterium]
VEHLTLALLKQSSGTAHDMLTQSAADADALYKRIAAGVGVERGDPITSKGLTNAAQDTMDRAAQIAGELHQPAIDSGHLLISLMGESDGLVREALVDTPLQAETMRDFMRRTSPTPAAMKSGPRIGRPIRGGRGPLQTPDGSKPEYVLVPTRAGRKPRPQTPRRWGNMPMIVAGLALLIAYLVFALPGTSTFTFVFVLVGWIFSVTLHEFGHALVAYMGGDYTVRDKGYLTFNPLKYTHPMLSIILPLIFLAMGGIGLPGGAVYIERHRLRSKWWGAAVSAAGPTANLLFAVLLALPFFTGLVDVDAIITKLQYEYGADSWQFANPNLTEEDYYRSRGLENPGSIWSNVELWSAVAFLAILQVTAVILNLIPLPPLDGFGIIEPLLDDRTRRTLLQIGFTGGIFLVFILLWMVEPVEREFWDTVFQITNALHIPNWLGALGHDAFMFWRDQ